MKTRTRSGSMANKEQLKILSQGVSAWNQWRVDNPDQYIDFSGANLSFSDLSGANLFEANLPGVSFLWTNLSEANLIGACLNGANLTGADLSGVDLTGADLIGTILVDTNLERSILTGCRVYGLSAWGVKLKDAIQKDLIITPFNEPVISVDNLEVAQFIYLLLHNEKIRQVIDTITSKVVLILGNFKPERKAILDAVREELRNRHYLPILFDFDKPSTRNTLETVTLLARLARFIIADITDPKSILQELVSIVPDIPSVPVKPILQAGSEPWGMYDAIECHPSVLELHYYHDLEDLLNSLNESVIAPAEAKVNEIRNICR